MHCIAEDRRHRESEQKRLFVIVPVDGDEVDALLDGAQGVEPRHRRGDRVKWRERLRDGVLVVGDAGTQLLGVELREFGWGLVDHSPSIGAAVPVPQYFWADCAMFAPAARLRRFSKPLVNGGMQTCAPCQGTTGDGTVE